MFTRVIAIAVIATLPVAAAAHAQSAAASQAAQMHALHAHDAPIATAAAHAAPGMAVDTSTVTYATVGGQAVHGFLARPAGAKKDIPGIIAIHEWWGLNDNVRAIAMRLAGEGYAVLAVDLMGEVARTPEDARRLMQKALDNSAQTSENLMQAIDYLRKSGSRKIGTIGWCFGGGWSLATGIRGGDKVNAVVMYYGRVVTDSASLAPLRAPLLGHFGTQDEGIPLDSVKAMAGTLDRLKKRETVEFYDAGHGFSNSSGRNYNAAAADAAWARTIAFYKKELQS